MAVHPPVLGSRGGEPELRIERRLNHPPATVWRAITEREHLSAWYPFPATELELRVGGRIRFAPMSGLTLDAEITDLREPSVFAFTVAAPGDLMPGGRERANTIRIELTPDGPGCLLRFIQTFADRPAAASYAAGWQSCLDALARVLDGDSGGDGDHSVSVLLYEEYVRLFGLDRGALTATTDGWLVRFDRQLMMQPPDRVWAALCAPAGTPAPGDPVPPGCTDGGAAGPVAAVEPGAALEYDRPDGERSGGRVRWDLRPGPGGARIVLTETGPGDSERDGEPALRRWHDRLAALVRQLNATAG